MNYYFKFYPPTPLAINSLQNRRIFFGSPSELNDPFEQIVEKYFEGDSNDWRALFSFFIMRSPWLRENREELLSLADKLPRRLSYNELVVTLRAKKDPTVERLIEEIETIEDLLFTSTYTCSFTKTAVSAALWGNYTDSGKGFALIVNCPDQKIRVKAVSEIFSDVEEGISGRCTSECTAELKPVDYNSPPLELNVFDELNHVLRSSYDDPPELVWPQFYTAARRKGATWRYEEEVRAIFPHLCSSIDPKPLPPSMRSLEIPEESVVGIVFGPRTSEATMLDVITGMSSNRTDRNLYWFKAQKKTDSFNYVIEPLCRFNYLVDQIPDSLNLYLEFEPNKCDVQDLLKQLNSQN